MLIRFALDNIYSFGDIKEINMFPAPKFSRLNDHKYKKCNIEILKMASLYGANGSGKSNLIKAISLLQDIVLEEDIPSAMLLRRYKFLHNTKKITTMVIEFINNNRPYIYGLEIDDKSIVKEELYVSGVGKKDDKLIFERTCNDEKKSNIVFNEDFYKNKEAKILGDIIKKNLLKNNKTCIKMLKDLENPILEDVKNVYNWFSEKLEIIMPNAKPVAITQLIDIDDVFHKYAEDILCSFNVELKVLNR